MKKIVLFTLVVVMICVNVGGIALTTTEKEQKYSNAILELETYLQSMVIDSISVALNGIKEELDELGNYEYSRELYYYVSVLMNIELEDYSDWHTDVWLEQLCKDNRFTAFTQDAGSTIANAETLKNYYLGRKAEFANDTVSAINYYDQCIGYFDASDRQMSLRRYAFEDMYVAAEKLMNQGKYEEAYPLFAQCGSYNDADIYASYIIDILGYNPLVCNGNHQYGNNVNGIATCIACGKKIEYVTEKKETKSTAAQTTEKAQSSFTPVTKQITMRKLKDSNARRYSYGGPGKGYEATGGYKPAKVKNVYAWFTDGDYILVDVVYQTSSRRIVYMRNDEFTDVSGISTAKMTEISKKVSSTTMAKFGPGNEYGDYGTVKSGTPIKVLLTYKNYVFGEINGNAGKNVRIWIPQSNVQ